MVPAKALDRRVSVRLTGEQRERMACLAAVQQRSSASVLREALQRMLDEREVSA